MVLNPPAPWTSCSVSTLNNFFWFFNEQLYSKYIAVYFLSLQGSLLRPVCQLHASINATWTGGADSTHLWNVWNQRGRQIEHGEICDCWETENFVVFSRNLHRDMDTNWRITLSACRHDSWGVVQTGNGCLWLWPLSCAPLEISEPYVGRWI